MSEDLKKELIPKMKAALAEVMSRGDSTREEPTTDGDPPDQDVVRSLSDRLRAKLRPVPARRAASAQPLPRRRGGRRAQTEGEESGTAPQVEGGESGSAPQAEGVDRSAAPHVETSPQPNQTGKLRRW